MFRTAIMMIVARHVLTGRHGQLHDEQPHTHRVPLVLDERDGHVVDVVPADGHVSLVSADAHADTAMHRTWSFLRNMVNTLLYYVYDEHYGLCIMASGCLIVSCYVLYLLYEIGHSRRM